MKIISNTAITLDGKISDGESHFNPLGSTEDFRRMNIIRNKCDAIILGGETFRCYSKPLCPKVEYLNEPLTRDFVWNVVVSQKMDFTISDDYLNDKRIKPLFLSSNHQAIKKLQQKTEAIWCEGVLDVEWIVEVLRAKGIKTLLIEGGGRLIFQFLEKNLIDEMYVTVCPKILGKQGLPSIAKGDHIFTNGLRQLELLQHEVVQSEIFLHYKVVPEKLKNTVLS